jgi:MFS family permease
VPEVESRQAAFVIALSQGAGMIIGGLSNDFICRRLGTARGRRVIVLFGMSLSALFALVSVNLKDASQVALFMALAMGSQGMCESIFWTTATEIGGKSRGFAGAFLNTGGNIGGFISPVLTPIMADRIGWTGAIAVACGICAFGGVVWFWIKLPDSAPTRISTAASAVD